MPHASIRRALETFAPVILQRGVRGYAADPLRAPGERRLLPTELRPLLIAAAHIGIQAAATEQGLERAPVASALAGAVQTLAGLTEPEKNQTLALVERFYSYRIIRADHNFDDWISEAFWGEFQTVPYVYPSTLSEAVAFGLIIIEVLESYTLEAGDPEDEDGGGMDTDGDGMLPS